MCCGSGDGAVSCGPFGYVQERKAGTMTSGCQRVGDVGFEWAMVREKVGMAEGKGEVG